MHTLAVTHISKHFTRKKALDDVSLSFETGAVYALLGENGAGKSTLASLLSGDAEPTAGSILSDGKQVVFKSPRDAIECGIVMVRQQPLLAPDLTLWENCILGSKRHGTGILCKRSTIDELTCLARDWNFSVELEKKAGTLTAPERLSGTLLASLYTGPRFLILDEPSATLDEEQRTALFSRLRKAARDDNLCIIFITHNIQEALDYADNITILQKGSVVFSENIGEKKPGVSEIADMLFARKENRGFTFAAPLPQAHDSSASSSTAVPVLELQDVTVRPASGAALFNISFSVPEGKLTLISGQRESGMDTLEDLVTGMMNSTHGAFRRYTHISGSILFRGKLLEKPLTPRFLRENGTAIIPFRKMIRGSHPELTVSELLGSTGAAPEKILTQVQTDISASEKVSALSGGMLQRLIIARELFSNPSFVIMSNPSYGLDRFSTGKVTETVEALLSEGATVLVLGDEPELEHLAENHLKLLSGHLEPYMAVAREVC